MVFKALLTESVGSVLFHQRETNFLIRILVGPRVTQMDRDGSMDLIQQSSDKSLAEKYASAWDQSHAGKVLVL